MKLIRPLAARPLCRLGDPRYSAQLETMRKTKTISRPAKGNTNEKVCLSGNKCPSNLSYSFILMAGASGKDFHLETSLFG